jgi:hypothetical protein
MARREANSEPWRLSVEGRPARKTAPRPYRVVLEVGGEALRGRHGYRTPGEAAQAMARVRQALSEREEAPS